VEIKNKIVILTLYTVTISQILLCVNHKGIDILDQTIYTANKKQFNTVGRPIRYDWNKIFKTLDLYKIDPNKYHYTKESQYGSRPTLLELAIDNNANKEADILIQKYKEQYPGRKDTLFDAIVGGHIKKLELLRYGANIKWENEEEFIKFILDPRFMNIGRIIHEYSEYGDFEGFARELSDEEREEIIKKVLENSHMVIHWDTYKKVIEQPWGEWWHYGTTMKKHPKDNPNNKVIEDYIKKKSNK
jgi:hypothetical protein